jgi:predicted permease
VGVLVAFLATNAAAEMLPTTIAFDLSPDASVVGFVLLLSALAAFLFGTAPAWILSGVNLTQALGRTGQGRTKALFRGGLVATQSALSVTLLIVGGLFARSLQEARAVPLGFETENRLLLSIRLGNHGYSEEEGRAFLSAARDRIAGVPGVRKVTAANRMPFQPRNNWDFVVPGTEYAEAGLYAGLNMVGADYLEVMGIPVVAGRSIGEADGPGAPRVVVVNRLFADRMWPGQNPLGKNITFAMEGEWRVVGVAENSTYWWLGEDPMPFVYFPLPQLFTGRMTFHVATLTDPMEVARAVERAMREIDPNLAIAVSTVEARLDQQLASFRIWTTFVALFSAVALFLSMVGLYGVQSFLVARRTKEIGIRMAVGARPRSVVGRVVVGGFVMGGIGVIVGVCLALVGMRLVQSFLFGVSLHDPLVYGLACATLTGASLVASFYPAARASRVDPVEALALE